jgi:hypothetical protein
VKSPIVALVTRYLGRLRYPWLFAITAGLFLLDVFIPDVVPLGDELLLALATMLIASRKRDDPDATSHDALKPGDDGPG